MLPGSGYPAVSGSIREGRPLVEDPRGPRSRLLRPVLQMILVAAWGFLVAKVLVVGDYLATGNADGLLIATLSSFGSDGAVILWLAALGWLLSRLVEPEGKAL